MRITPLSGPTAEPLSVEELKAALRITHDAEDDQILQMARTARHFIERRWDLAFLTQSWRAEAIARPGGDVLLRPRPVARVERIDILAADGTVRTVPVEETTLHAGTGRLWLGDGARAGEAVTIDFVAGYETAAEVPDDLLRALYLLTAHYFEERELFRAERYVPVPMGVETLLSPFRQVTL